MAQINDYLIGDPYRPPLPLPALQQYDNYQIYSLFCVDKMISVVVNNVSGNYTNKLNDWIAIQSYSPFRKIPLDFRSIILAHP
jgi:hypothetical protein